MSDPTDPTGRATVRKLRRAYRRGGVLEVVRATGRRLVGTVRRGTDPQPTPVVAAPTAPAASATPIQATGAGQPSAASADGTVAAPKSPPVLSALTVSYDDAAAWFDRRRATYDRLAAAAARYVEPDGVIFDVGANIGYFTQTLTRTAGFRGTAHLFEPLPHLVELCRVTAADLPCTAVVHDVGLSDEAAQVDLFVAASGNLGWNTVVAERAGADMVPVQVRVVPLADTAITDRPSFVKIDVEGAEYRVLAGMLDALESWDPRPAILCEIGWGRERHPAWEAELEVFARLAGLGYTAHDLVGGPVDVTAVDRTTDVLFLPAHLRPEPPEGGAEPGGTTAELSGTGASDRPW